MTKILLQSSDGNKQKPAARKENVIDVKNLYKSYGKVRVLNNVNLCVNAGMVFALLGPNGAGKTTLMRILTTQIRLNSGSVYVCDLNVNSNGAEIRKIVSYVPQEMSVWTDISGFENLLIYAKIYGIPFNERKVIIEEGLEIMGLKNVANNLVRTYSGGMIRRLEILCTMLSKPRIMFLDEPTIGLDPSARKTVWEKMIAFSKKYNTTIFFNTHYMDEADLYADEIAIINKGKIIKTGTAKELKDSMGNETITFNLGIQINKQTLEKIKKLHLVKAAGKTGELGLRVIVKDSETALPCIIEILKSKAVISKISIHKPTLDDVFFKYAGRKIETVEQPGRITQTRKKIGGH